MSRIPAHTLHTVPDGSREIAGALERRMGSLLNIHATMAHSPVVLAAYHGMSQAIALHGTFDARTREAIALAVANQNECDYCQAAHTASGRRTGMSEAQIRQIRLGEVDFDARIAAITELARSAAANTGDVPDAVWQAGLDAGWHYDELVEAFAHVAVNLFTNYFNHYARTDLDLPEAEPLMA